MSFQEISLLLVIAAVFGSIAKVLRQPLLIGYLFAGLAMSYLGFVHDVEVFEGLGQIGVALLLFLVGVEMNLTDLPKIGKIALITGLGQIIFTSLFGFAIAYLLGFSSISSLYIAIALTFSSTIIIVKLLSEKNDLDSLYGKISIGFLLVQDFVAMILLILLSGMSGASIDAYYIFIIIFKSLLLFASVWILSKEIMPVIYERFLLHSQELTFVVTLAWALGFAMFVSEPLGFSFEIGGFLAGLALSNLPDHLQIASRTRPLRDFFLTIFFILLGSKLIVGDVGSLLVPASIFSIFVLVGNPIIVLMLMGWQGYKRRTSFLSGLTVAQISEFSFIIVAMGAQVGHLSDEVVAMVILVGVITMTVSTYMILGSDKLFSKLKNKLSIFERKITTEEIAPVLESINDHVVLAGAGKSGHQLLKYFEKKNIPLVLIDFDPDIYEKCHKHVDTFLLGDINDPEVQEAANIKNAKAIISTVFDLSDNLNLLTYAKKVNKKAYVYMTAINRHDAKVLYSEGADFVVVPQETAGEYLKHLFSTYGIASKRIKAVGKSRYKKLRK